MLARPVLCVAFLVLAGVTAWPNGAGLKSCTLGQPGGSELGGGWTTHGDHMVAEGRGPYRLTVKGLEVGGTYDPKGIYQMTLSSVNGTSIIQGFMVSPNVRHGTGRTFSGKESRLLSCHPNDPVQHVLTHNQEKAKKSVEFVMEPPLCGTWVIRSTVYVGAPPSGKYWIFSQGYMGPKCAACGAGEWSLDGMAPCRKCDDCSTRGGVLSQGPGRVLQSDSSHPRASPNCTATADTGCVLPRSCQLGLTFSTSGREPCTACKGCFEGVQYHLQDSCTLTANTVCDTTVNVDPGVLTLNGGDNRPSSAASPQAPAVRQIAVVSLLAVFVVGGRSSVWRR